MDWHAVDVSSLFEHLRSSLPSAEAERMIWAFEKALGVARVDAELLEHTLVATACLIAYARGETPRTIMEQFFRRSVADNLWRARYASLLR